MPHSGSHHFVGLVARAVGGTYASAADDRLLVLMFAVPFAAGILLLAAAAAWGV